VLRNIRVYLEPLEIEEFRSRLDVNGTGMVEYKDFTDIGSWIMFGNFLKV